MWYFIITVFLVLVHLCPGAVLYISLGGPSPFDVWQSTPMMDPAPPPQCWGEWREIGFLWILMIPRALFACCYPPPLPIDLEKLHLCLCLTELDMWMYSFLSTICVDYSIGILYIVFTRHLFMLIPVPPTYMFILLAQLQEWINNFNDSFLKQTWWARDVQWMIIFALSCVL